MKSITTFLFISFYGVFGRIIFGMIPSFEVMGIGVLLIAPFVLGFLTNVFTAKKLKFASSTQAFFRPWISCVLILFITMAFNIEGSICWIMIFPFFAISAGIGGVIAHHMIIKKRTKIQKNNNEIIDDDFTSNNSLKISVSMMFLPFLFAAIEKDYTLSKKEITNTHEIVIDANSKEVWDELTTKEIEVSSGNYTWTNLIFNFPKHINTTIDSLSVGGKRTAYYERGLQFEEEILTIEPHKKLVLGFDINPSEIPTGIMDEHIVLGGKYADINKDTYELTPLENGKTLVRLTSEYFINTSINWYAQLWSDWVISSILNNELSILKTKVENARS